MRVLLTFLLLSALPLWGLSPIEEAYRLWSDGQIKETVTMLEPLVAADSHSLSESDRGLAWGMLASSYQDLEMYPKARRAYQMALEILPSIPSAKAQYAAIIANFATMEESQGQMRAAQVLFEKAVHLYEELGDHAGLGSAYTDLAVMKFAQNDDRASRRALEKAFALQGNSPSDDDLAAMNSVKAALALRAGHAEDAVAAVQISIESWTRSRGPDFYMLGTTYLLRARALARTGEYSRALVDVQHALAIAEATVGKQSIGYLTAKGVYGEILKASGARDEGSRMQQEARRALNDLQGRQCSRCTIDASAFR